MHRHVMSLFIINDIHQRSFCIRSRLENPSIYRLYSMEVMVDDILKDIVESTNQIKSIHDCIEEGEFRAARKLLKRHETSVVDATKKMKKSFLDMKETIRYQRLTIASMKKSMFKKEKMKQKDSGESSKLTTQEYDEMDDSLDDMAAATAADDHALIESDNVCRASIVTFPNESSKLDTLNKEKITEFATVDDSDTFSEYPNDHKSCCVDGESRENQKTETKARHSTI
jgi:sugar-specific transcriptional regulator TrmB